VPEPSAVLLLAVVGFAAVFQQTPRAVTAAPPSAVILPPLCAVVSVKEVTAVVAKVGKPGAVGTGLSGFLQPLKTIIKIKTRIEKNDFFFIIIFFSLNQFLIFHLRRRFLVSSQKPRMRKTI
jgi:uncharacterized membrane protein